MKQIIILCYEIVTVYIISDLLNAYLEFQLESVEKKVLEDDFSSYFEAL